MHIGMLTCKYAASTSYILQLDNLYIMELIPYMKFSNGMFEETS